VVENVVWSAAVSVVENEVVSDVDLEAVVVEEVVPEAVALDVEVVHLRRRSGFR
jgi:hypothetical protein